MSTKVRLFQAEEDGKYYVLVTREYRFGLLSDAVEFLGNFATETEGEDVDVGPAEGSGSDTPSDEAGEQSKDETDSRGAQRRRGRREAAVGRGRGRARRAKSDDVTSDAPDAVVDSDEGEGDIADEPPAPKRGRGRRNADGKSTAKRGRSAKPRGAQADRSADKGAEDAALTAEDLAKACSTAAGEVGPAAVKKLLKQYEVATVNDLDPSQRRVFLKGLEALVDDAD